ncbi:MAG: TonB-dependent receptor, partial [Alphaproteobacteria bacterium]|nr:TonB-dependent receptor [Alphaproteobacteria bacterium]
MLRRISISLVSTAALLTPSTAWCADPHTSAADPTAPSETEIVVTGPRTEKTARDVQREAPNLVNVQSAETIAKYPDYNAAEALGRVPGVALSQDTGEGRFVNIRGLDGNLNGATFGGVVLLNTQPGGTYFNSAGRAVEFDTVPIGAVDRIEVIKTGLPDRDAEGLGGQVELTPRTAIGHDPLFLDATLGAGYQPLRKTGLYRVDMSFGGSFGTNADGQKLFHAVVNLFRHDDRRGIDDVEEGYSDNQPTIPDKAFSALELRRYIYWRRRYGATSEFDITPSADHRLFLRASLAGYTERVNRQRLVIAGLDGGNGSGIITTDPHNPNGFFVPDALALKTLRDEEEAHRNLILQVGGEHHFGAVKFDWFAALSRSTYQKYYDRNTTFAGPGTPANPAGAFPVTYDNTTDPNHPVFSTGSVNVADPANYVLSGIFNQTEYDRDLEHSFAANLSVSPGLTDGDEIKVGAKLRLRHKMSMVGSTSVAGSGQPLSQFLTGGPLIYYGGLYDIGPMIDRDRIVGAFGAALAIGPLGRNDIQFDDHEDVTAGYIQYHGKFGPLGILAGVRAEHTVAHYGGFVGVKNDNSGNVTTQFNNIRSSYTNLFPTVQLRYQATPSLVARATYSTGIARPGFLQTIQNGQVDLVNQVVTTGNPNLKPTYGHNFDVALEYYLPNSGIISIGAFDKEFRNYIVARTFHGLYPPSGSQLIFLFQSFDNVSGAYARGIEASFVDRFRFLPAPFDGFGVDSNVAYVKSGVSLRQGEPKRLLPGTFPWSANAALFYEKGPVQLRLAAQYES